jgi:LemA protein
MSSAAWIMLIGVALLVGAGALLAAGYNRLVTLRNRYQNAWAQIDVQLKRRYDLIPNLVEAVKGYMAHERQTLEAVTVARNAAAVASAGGAAEAARVPDVARAEQALGGALHRLRLVAEAYPALKADRSASALMEELTSTENRIAFARQAYNDAVMRYSTARSTFPTALVAGAFGFAAATLFEIQSPPERAAVQVSLQPAPPAV